MDTEVIVFLVSAGLSFGPLYLVLKALDKRRGIRLQNRPKSVAGASKAHEEFVALLRTEAADRAVVALDSAFREARGDTSAKAPFRLSAEARRRLEDAHRLVDCLLPGEAQTAFERAAFLVARPSAEAVRQGSAEIEDAIGALKNAANPPRPLKLAVSAAVPATTTKLSTIFSWALRPRDLSKRHLIDDKQRLSARSAG